MNRSQQIHQSQQEQQDRKPSNASQQPNQQHLTADSQKKFTECQYHPCRSKYFCVEPDCQASTRAACGECYTEQPHHLHKIIQQEEYEQTLKQNYQKVQQQYGTIETTHTLIQKVKNQYKQLKNQIIYSLDQAESHVIREIQSQQDNYETEKFKTLNLRIKQLKSNFFYGGCAAFDKTIGDFSLKLYNLDEDVLNYISDVKKERETYYQPFQEQFKQIQENLEGFITQQISPLFDISPKYPMQFQIDDFDGKTSILQGIQGKPNTSVKFIHNSDNLKNQQLDSKDQKSISSYQNFILTCSMDKTLRLWNLGQDGHEDFEAKLWKTYQFEKKTIMAITQVNYEDFVTGSDDGFIQVWRVSDGACKSKFSHFDSQNSQIDKKLLQNGFEYQESNQKFEQELSLADQNQAVSLIKGVSFVRTINEAVVIAGYNDGSIRIWDIQRGIILKSYNFHQTQPQTKYELQQRTIKDICKVSQWIFATTGSKIKPGQENENMQQNQNQEEQLNSQFDQSKKIQLEEQHQVIIYNWQKEELVMAYEGHQDRITSVIKMEDNLMVSASMDGQIHLWNLSDGAVQKVIQNESKLPIKQLIKLSDTLYATGGNDLKIQIWDINQEEPIKTCDQLAPKSEEESQIQAQKPNHIQFLLRISETTIVSGTTQAPYLHIWK